MSVVDETVQEEWHKSKEYILTLQHVLLSLSKEVQQQELHDSSNIRGNYNKKVSLIMPAHPCGKRPLYIHKGGTYTLDSFYESGADEVIQRQAAVILLSHDIIVVDIDDQQLAQHFFDNVPSFAHTVSAVTQKGRHFYFRNTVAAKQAEIYDGARQLYYHSTDTYTASGQDDKMPIDIKTMAKSGTSGVISIVPSPNKRWIVPPIPSKESSIEECTKRFLPLPDEFVELFSSRNKPRNQMTTVTNGTARQGESSVDTGVSSTEVLPSIETVEKALYLIKQQRCVDFTSWRDVGFALHHLACLLETTTPGANTTLLAMWDKWSQLVPSKYKPNDCARRWNTFRPPGEFNGEEELITIRSLFWWLKEDDAEGFLSLVQSTEHLDKYLFQEDEEQNANDQNETDSVAKRILKDPKASELMRLIVPLFEFTNNPVVDSITDVKYTCLKPGEEAISMTTRKRKDKIVHAHKKRDTTDIIPLVTVHVQFSMIMDDGRKGDVSIDFNNLVATGSLGGNVEKKDIFIASDTGKNILNLISKYDLAGVHPDIQAGQEWQIFRQSRSTAVFKSSLQNAKIEWINVDQPGLESGKIELLESGKKKQVKTLTRRDLDLIKRSYTDTTQDVLHKGTHTGWLYNQINYNYFTQNICNSQIAAGNITNITLHRIEDNAEAFNIIRNDMMQYALEHKLRKHNGYIYEPLPDCPCAYKKTIPFSKFVNISLKHNEVFRQNPKRFKEAIDYLTDYEDDHIPQYDPDRDLISFRNGVLSLETRTFYDHSHESLNGKVARHHIDQDYKGPGETPNFTSVFESQQFDKETCAIIMAMMGRCLFQVNQLDRWQVMMFLVGLAGTGKSLLTSILEHFFRPGEVANLASKREEKFGLANLFNKEIIIGRDMPDKLSQSLPQEFLQSMTSGEGMEIAIKYKDAVNVTWAAPVVMASNYDPDYRNESGQISRRLVIIRFDKRIMNPDPELMKKIIDSELSTVIANCLLAYEELRDKVRTSGGSIWKVMPAQVMEWQNKYSASTNVVHEFFEAEEDERGWCIEKVPGHVTWMSDFKKALEDWIDKKRELFDKPKKDKDIIYKNLHIFHQFGYNTSQNSTDTENVCSSCKQIAKARGDTRCCAAYVSVGPNKTRTTKTVIYDMRFTKLTKVDERLTHDNF